MVAESGKHLARGGHWWSDPDGQLHECLWRDCGGHHQCDCGAKPMEAARD